MTRRAGAGRSRLISATLAVLAAGAVVLLPGAGAQAGDRIAADGTVATTVYRVTGGATQSHQLLRAGFDVLERRQGQDLFVLAKPGDGDRLRQAGFAFTEDPSYRIPTWTPPAQRAEHSAAAPADADETYYGGYHTVNAQYAHLDEVAAAHPDLAVVETYGQSWRKTQGQGGYDLKAVCITKKAEGDCARTPDAKKPRFFLMSQLHAREITTGEVSRSWIDHLVNGYGKDDAVTKLLDTTELWVVPVANPDGVEVVQQGGDNPAMQRKNLNGSHGDCQGTDIGVDLNRNADSHYGESGTSTDPCDETFGGPNADSEVELSSLQKLFGELYPDKREDGDTTAAPADTTGMMITMHSDASQVIFPWGHDSTVKTGNDAALRAFGKELGDTLGYVSGQAGEILYDSAGGTEDWSYEKLGVASYTIEVGDSDNRGCDGFFPAYTCQPDYFWPKMLPGLMQSAQQAAAPYAE